MSTEVEIKDNSELCMKALFGAIQSALEKIGLVAEGYAKKLCPVDTGNLRNSITHQVVLNGAVTTSPEVINISLDGTGEVYIGTNVEYAAYVELGTGSENVAGGRPTPWVYQDAKGQWHYTRGNKAQPFLKPAAERHAAQYKRILEDELKNGQQHDPSN